MLHACIKFHSEYCRAATHCCGLLGFTGAGQPLAGHVRVDVCWGITLPGLHISLPRARWPDTHGDKDDASLHQEGLHLHHVRPAVGLSGRQSIMLKMKELCSVCKHCSLVFLLEGSKM